MNNVIEVNFGISQEDKDMLAGIYTSAKIDCSNDADYKERFNKLSIYSLAQEKALRHGYQSMMDILTKVQNKFYSSGQTEADLEVLDFVRNKLQELESLIIDSLRD